MISLLNSELNPPSAPSPPSVPHPPKPSSLAGVTGKEVWEGLGQEGKEREDAVSSDDDMFSDERYPHIFPSPPSPLEACPPLPCTIPSTDDTLPSPIPPPHYRWDKAREAKQLKQRETEEREAIEEAKREARRALLKDAPVFSSGGILSSELLDYAAGNPEKREGGAGSSTYCWSSALLLEGPPSERRGGGGDEEEKERKEEEEDIRRRRWREMREMLDTSRNL